MSGAATTYAIRVEGHLDDHWSAWLGGLDMTRDDDGATTFTVEVADQAHLHGVLAGLRDIGAVISELRTEDAPVPIRRPVLERPLHTERLTLRPAGDADPARLATTIIVTLGQETAAPIIGEFTLRREGASAQLGWVLDPAYAGYTSEAVRELLRHCFLEDEWPPA